jgi:hypothetical protein
MAVDHTPHSKMFTREVVEARQLPWWSALCCPMNSPSNNPRMFTSFAFDQTSLLVKLAKDPSLREETGRFSLQNVKGIEGTMKVVDAI